jgi:two-component system, NtrC family, response regulator PilR
VFFLSIQQAKELKVKERDERDRKLPPRVLVVDDEADLRELLELTLVRMGLRVDLAEGVGAAKNLLDSNTYDLCLSDMRMQDGDGLEVVKHIQAYGLDVPIAVITAYGSTDNAIAALKAGAFDYLAKPVGLDQLRTLVKSALRVPDTARNFAQSGGVKQLAGESSAMVDVRELIDRVARSQAPVYVTGESGSGKELAAQRLHALSGRSGEFIAVNCGAIPESLMESEFFGYRKGAFTGADSDRGGFFQAAHGGTLFLDEVADLPAAMQVKLLRVIQEKKVRKVGSTVEEPIDVRVVSATHQDLSARAANGRFRQDLLYRLNVIEIKMPSLRDCREDIALLAETIISRLTPPGGRGVALSPAALACLVGYDFPGNVRELENILERALALAASATIEPGDLRLVPAAAEIVASIASASEAVGALARGLSLQDYLDQMERTAIHEALEQAGHNRTAAARLLGVTFRSFRYRLQRLGIEL